MTQLPIVVPRGFRIIAHRGASAYAPENTMAAFTLAERMGICEVELDVQLSRDAHLVICHDRVLDRYGYPGRVLAELTLRELQSLDMGSWFSPFLFPGEKMLTLEQLLNRFGNRFTYHIEIKEPAPGIERAVLDEIDRSANRSRIIVTSFNDVTLEQMKELAPDISLGLLVRDEGLSEASIRRALELGCLQICPRAKGLVPEEVEVAQKKLAEVRAHGIKGLADVIWAIECGVDGMTINWPDWLAYEEEE